MLQLAGHSAFWLVVGVTQPYLQQERICVLGRVQGYPTRLASRINLCPGSSVGVLHPIFNKIAFAFLLALQY
jgi:hypothetical protein